MGEGDALRGALVRRMCRRVGPRFNRRVGAYNIIDFAAPAVQQYSGFRVAWRLAAERASCGGGISLTARAF